MTKPEVGDTVKRTSAKQRKPRESAKDTRPENAAVMYWIGTTTLVLINAAAVSALRDDPNTVVLAVVLANLAIFGCRGVYAFSHRRELFKETTFRRAEGATSAERVAVYVFATLMLAAIIQSTSQQSGLDIDDSLTELGESIILLAIGAPVITYLTSGYGQLRDIVHDGRARSMEGFTEPTAQREHSEAPAPQAPSDKKGRASKKPKAKWTAMILVLAIAVLVTLLSLFIIEHDATLNVFNFMAGAATLGGLVSLSLSDFYPRWVKEDGASDPENVDEAITKFREWGHVLVLSGAIYLVAGHVATLASQ